jgi:hypothetical protein
MNTLIASSPIGELADAIGKIAVRWLMAMAA